jgi:hypothetical protein
MHQFESGVLEVVTGLGLEARAKLFAWPYASAFTSAGGLDDVHGWWRLDCKYEYGDMYPMSDNQSEEYRDWTRPYLFARRRWRRLFRSSYWKHRVCLLSQSCGRRGVGLLCVCEFRNGGDGRAAP